MVINKTITVCPKVPWFNDNIKKAKCERKKLERKWRLTRSQHDLDLFKLQKNNATFLMKIARQDYYTRFIEDNSTNPKKLFKAAGSLFRNNVSLLPLHIDDLPLV